MIELDKALHDAIKENWENSKKKMILEITGALHSNIKQRAALRNITLRKWVLQAIAEKIAAEDRYR